MVQKIFLHIDGSLAEIDGSLAEIKISNRYTMSTYELAGQKQGAHQ